MSVLIKTMEMPKNCGECQLCHTENFNLWCCLTGREDIFYDAMPEWCPLEKPKTGEWIDEDGTYYANCSKCGYQMDTHQERGYFRYCPKGKERGRMTREEAQQAWEKMRSEIDKENWLFVGTINPQMVDIAIDALKAQDSPIICPRCGRTFAESEGRERDK